MNNFYARDPASVLCTYFPPQTKLNVIIYTTACNVLEGLKCLYHGLKLGHELEYLKHEVANKYPQKM
jgi:hypothetical protein